MPMSSHEDKEYDASRPPPMISISSSVMESEDGPIKYISQIRLWPRQLLRASQIHHSPEYRVGTSLPCESSLLYTLSSTL